MENINRYQYLEANFLILFYNQKGLYNLENKIR
jgi:hypothetical protein